MVACLLTSTHAARGNTHPQAHPHLHAHSLPVVQQEWVMGSKPKGPRDLHITLTATVEGPSPQQQREDEAAAAAAAQQHQGQQGAGGAAPELAGMCWFCVCVCVGGGGRLYVHACVVMQGCRSS